MDFTNVAVGTKCFVETWHGWYITYVDRHTKTQVITKTNKNVIGKWKINSGAQVNGDRWRPHTLEVFTDKHQEIVDASLLRRDVGQVLDILGKYKTSVTKEDYEMLKALAIKYKD